jgi:hypothetical protein
LLGDKLVPVTTDREINNINIIIRCALNSLNNINASVINTNAVDVKCKMNISNPALVKTSIIYSIFVPLIIINSL